MTAPDVVPSFTLTADDPAAVPALLSYAAATRDPEGAAIARAVAHEFMEWQDAHGIEEPTLGAQHDGEPPIFGR